MTLTNCKKSLILFCFACVLTACGATDSKNQVAVPVMNTNAERTAGQSNEVELNIEAKDIDKQLDERVPEPNQPMIPRAE